MTKERNLNDLKRYTAKSLTVFIIEMYVRITFYTIGLFYINQTQVR